MNIAEQIKQDLLATKDFDAVVASLAASEGIPQKDAHTICTQVVQDMMSKKAEPAVEAAVEPAPSGAAFVAALNAPTTVAPAVDFMQELIDEEIAAAAPIADPLPLLPAVMKVYTNWVTYKSKTEKAPIISGTTQHAKSDDPATWVDYRTLCENIQAGRGYSLPGFVCDGVRTGGFTGIDIDGCKTDAGVAAWVQPVLDAIGPSYTEWTPNLGLRVWVRADFGKNTKFAMDAAAGYNGKAQKVEVFGDGLYFTVTGNRTEWSAKDVATLSPEQVTTILEALQNMAVVKAAPEKPKSTNPPDPAFKALFDAVGWEPIERRMAQMSDARFNNLKMVKGKMIFCPMPGHQPRGTQYRYTPCFGVLPDGDVCHCFGCDFSGDMVSTVRAFDVGEDGGRKTYATMYDCARAICVEQGLNPDEYFPVEKEVIFNQQPDPVKTPDELAKEATEQLEQWLAGDIELETEEVVKLTTYLSPTKYENRRVKIHKKLGWRSNVLDAARREAMPKKGKDSEGDEAVIVEIEPWPESVVLSDVLAEIEKHFRTYVHFKRPEDAITAALWCAQTHAADFQTKFPYLGARSPVPECGKTTLLTIVSYLVRRAFMASSMTSASVFRVMHIFKPTLIIDELDTFIDKDPELVGILNSGHSREAGKVVRVLGEDLELRTFITYGPKAYGMIGNAPNAFKSRSLPIILEPKIAKDNVQDYPRNDAALKTDLRVLARKLARWCLDNEQAIRDCQPEMGSLLNRRKDNWHPLMVAATLAGGDWADRARKAAGLEDPFEEEPENKVFLRDVRNIFHTRKVEWMKPTDLMLDLRNQIDSGWAEYGKRNDGLNTKHLARFFGGFGVAVKKVYDPISRASVRAYCVTDMTEVFERHLKDEAVEEVPVRDSLVMAAPKFT